MKKILAFSGSSSSKSINQKLVKSAVSLLDQCTATVIDIREFPLPIYSIDIEETNGIPENARKVRTMFSEHDGFIISCPENNGSMPAIFKNLIDWISRMEGRIFQDKPVLLLSTSPGMGGGKTNLSNIETLMPWWGGIVVSTFSVGNFHDQFDGETHQLKNKQLQDDLTTVVRQLQTKTQLMLSGTPA